MIKDNKMLWRLEKLNLTSAMIISISNSLINGDRQIVHLDLGSMIKRMTVERKEYMPRNKTLTLVTINSTNRINYSL